MKQDIFRGLEGDFDFVDLTHPLRVGMPVWPDHPPFEQRKVSSLENGDLSCNHALCMSGAIRSGDAVMFSFGWARYWAHPEHGDRFFRDWPGLSRQASEALIERGVRIVGSDSLSIDRFSSSTFPAHNALLAADVLIGENFAKLDQLPPWCSLVALPLPIEGGSGSPTRAIAMVPRG